MSNEEGQREAGASPENRVQIGGDAECDHQLRRAGSDGGYNIYFECTDCSGAIITFSGVDDHGSREQNDRIEADLPREPPASDDGTHPLVGGLTPESSGNDSETGPLEKLGSTLRSLFGNDRKK